jgi:CubicO group peptidase (beta-lactamase class C family)
MTQSVSGGGHHGGGVFINSMDMARFGLLFLRDGKWNNNQILSEKWINTIKNPSKANPNYGYLWWLNTDKSWKDIPENTYYALGFGGNYIVIDKENDLVVVARWMDTNKMGDFMSLIIKSISNK